MHDTLGKDRALKHRLGITFFFHYFYYFYYIFTDIIKGKSTDDRPLLGGLRIGKEDPEGKQLLIIFIKELNIKYYNVYFDGLIIINEKGILMGMANISIISRNGCLP